MGTKIEPAARSPLAVTTFYDVPDDPLLYIFQSLDFASCLKVRQVCRHWKVIVADCTTIYSQYVQEKNNVERLSFLSPRFSAWEPMPSHWGLHNIKKVIKRMFVFSSVDQDIIAFYPPGCMQSSSSSLPFSDRNILLGQYESTYFLTPQGQTRLQLDLQTGLKPLVNHTLIVINVKDPTKNREFSLLGDLPDTMDNVAGYQIEQCFPISENKIALITANGKISFWDLLPEKPICYQTLQMKCVADVYKVGNHLISNNEIVDLSNPLLVEHEINFMFDSIRIFGSSFCAYSNKEILFFTENSHGSLGKKWDLKIDNLVKLINPKNGCVIVDFHVKEMNEKFIVTTYWQTQAVTLFILSTEGELVHFITQEIAGEPMQLSSLDEYPIFVHLSGNILVYKNPQEHTLYFWHIPTKKCIQQFEWTGAIYNFPLWCEMARVQDVLFSEGKLTIWLSSGHTSNRPAQFGIIQFDPQFMTPTGWRGMFSRIYSAVKGAYFALTGNNPS